MAGILVEIVDFVWEAGVWIIDFGTGMELAIGIQNRTYIVRIEGRLDRLLIVGIEPVGYVGL